MGVVCGTGGRRGPRCIGGCASVANDGMSVGRQYRVVPRTSVHAVLIATGVAVVTCLTRLGSQPLSWDEAVTANAGRRSWTALWTLLGHTDAPLGAYYAVMHVWIDGVGMVGVHADEFWLRLPSAVAGVGTVALTALLGARVYGPVLGATGGSCLRSIRYLCSTRTTLVRTRS